MGNATRNDGTDTPFTIENVTTGAGNDVITGSNTQNVLISGSGHDIIDARDGDDVVLGDEGNDDISGGAGNDTIDAGEGDDTVLGGSGQDEISGSNGSDVIRGAAENDIPSGAVGANTFGANDGIYMDYIADFDASEDQFAFDAGFFNDAYGDGFVELSDVLRVWTWAGNSWLAADTADYELQLIADLKAVDDALILDRIADQSILNFEEDETELSFVIGTGVFEPIEASVNWDVIPAQASVDPSVFVPAETRIDTEVFAPTTTSFDVDFP